MKRLKLVIVFSILLCLNLSAQSNYHQNIRGKVTDKDSQAPIIGVSVYVEGANPAIFSTTDSNGEFKLSNVPVGRHVIQFSYVGYSSLSIPNVLVSSGKEAMLNVEMKEDMSTLAEATVTAKKRKGESLNSMATLSTRTFNVEETRRYAGGMDDPARLASAFAGVAANGNTESNAIIVRGNAPTGVMWQVEGVEVPTPSHFANVDVMGGGGISLFSNQILSNSSFYTGAFPAEFGNASAGVFDIQLRAGNNNKHEYSFSIGALGVEASAEGPFKKNGSSSFLVNYRYSTFGLVKPFLSHEGLPIYQDLCFKLNFPTKQAGTFSIWGIGGIDNYAHDLETNPDKWTDDSKREEINSNQYPGSAGINHKILIGSKTYIQTSLAASSQSKDDKAKWIAPDLSIHPKEHSRFSQYKFTLKSVANHKFNKYLSSRTGLVANRYQYDYKIRHAFNTGDTISPLVDLASSKGFAMSYQFFTQFKYDVNEKLSFNGGIHSMYFDLNKKYTIEPRLGIKYSIGSKSSISLAYGLNSQMQMLSIYFIEKEVNGAITLPNKDLDFTKAHHFVLGFDYYINNNTRIRIEPYYQKLYDMAVEPNSSFALVNLEDLEEFDKSLESTGTGYNYGVDLTFERFLDRGFFYLATLSLFKSKYKGGDGIERSTLYDYGYVSNLLAGKEWKVGKNGKNNLLGLSGRLYLKGGDRQTPVDYLSSENSNSVIYDESRLFEDSAPMLYRLDISATYRLNKKKVSHVFAVQLLNILSSPTLHKMAYDYPSKTVKEEVDGSPFPSISWKIEF